jgi:outer membrane usher protein
MAFDTDKLTLNVVMPQIYLDMYAMGYISPERWDQGINALSVNYDFQAPRPYALITTTRR